MFIIYYTTARVIKEFFQRGGLSMLKQEVATRAAIIAKDTGVFDKKKISAITPLTLSMKVQCVIQQI